MKPVWQRDTGQLAAFERKPMVDEPQPVPVAFVIIIEPSGKCLMCRRVDTREWSFVGGGIKPGETPEEAAIREAHEETGFWLTRVTPLMRRVKDGTDCTTFTALVDRPFEPTFNAEHDRFEWLDPREAIAAAGAPEPGADIDIERQIMDKLDDLEARAAKVEDALA
jgi:8-oxo-dGTP pyrophosphatase MutT (NUDIX family)